MRWIRLDAFEPPDSGRGRCLEIEGRTVGVFLIDGTLHAVEGICPHRGGPLWEGLIEGVSVACPWHGWEFDVTTGRNVHSPDLAIRRFPLEHREDGLYIALD